MASGTPTSNGDLLEPEEEDAEPQPDRQARWGWRMPAAFGRTLRGHQAQDQMLRWRTGIASMKTCHLVAYLVGGVIHLMAASPRIQPNVGDNTLNFQA